MLKNIMWMLSRLIMSSIQFIWIKWNNSMIETCPIYLSLLHVLVSCLCSISPEPLKSSCSLCLLNITWACYGFMFLVCVLYPLSLLHVLVSCLCSISPEPLKRSCIFKWEQKGHLNYLQSVILICMLKNIMWMLSRLIMSSIQFIWIKWNNSMIETCPI
jgi:hypothetical protein